MDSPNATTLSRRQALMSLAGAASATALAYATAATASAQANWDYAARCQAWLVRNEAYNRFCEEYDPRHLRPAQPEPPVALGAPLPDYGEPAYKIWDAKSLEEVIDRKTYLVVENSKDGPWNVMRVARLPASPELLNAAADMLALRRAYDAELERWSAEFDAIDAASTEIVDAIYDEVMELILTPVFSAADLGHKIEIAQAIDLFAEAGPMGEQTRDAIAADVARIAAREARS